MKDRFAMNQLWLQVMLVYLRLAPLRGVIIDEVPANRTCDVKASCEKLLATLGPDEIFWHECNCDEFCSTYGDCYSSFQDNQRMRINRSLLTCVPTIYGGVSMIKTCPSNWEEENTKRLCESHQNGFVPHVVISLRTGVTYDNLHCLECHSFEGLSRGDASVRIVDREITYEDVPEPNRYLVRRCSDSAIFDCPDSWTDENVREKCGAYNFLVYAGMSAYRNPHCALCNGISEEELTCWMEGEHIFKEEEEEEYLAKAISSFNFITKFGDVCAIISIVFLTLQLLSFTLFKDLRDLNGMNLASLCAAQLLLHLGRMFNMNMVLHSNDSLIAIIGHYLYLASLFWVQIIGYDIWRMLKLSKEFRRVHGRRGKRFAFYSIWGWGAPLCYELVSIWFVAYLIKNGFIFHRHLFNLRFCGDACQTATFFSLVPVVVIVFINSILFSACAFIIYSSTMRRTYDVDCIAIKGEFVTYARLALVMGLNWIVGFIGGYFFMNGLLYAIHGMGMFQSIFIFLAFTCSEKTRRNVKKMFGCPNGVVAGV